MNTGAVERREVRSGIRKLRSEEQIGSWNNYGVGNVNEPYHYGGYGYCAEKHPVQDTYIGLSHLALFFKSRAKVRSCKGDLVCMTQHRGIMIMRLPWRRNKMHLKCILCETKTAHNR